MAVTVEASGTQSATINTEHTLGAALTTAKSFLLVVNLTNMAGGDELELRAKRKVLSAGALAQIDMAVFQHAQADAVAILGPYPSAHSMEFSLKQTAGTGRNYEWSEESV